MKAEEVFECADCGCRHLFVLDSDDITVTVICWKCGHTSTYLKKEE